VPRTIVEIADEYEAAVIVLGSQGRSTRKSILLGSVSHEVVQHSSRPVLVVHSQGSSGSCIAPCR
jgi:nucleotide-binding universal stress UspA family protein